MPLRKTAPVSPRTTSVLMRMSLPERAEAQRAADRAGMPLSSYLRDRGLAAARRDLQRAA